MKAAWADKQSYDAAFMSRLPFFLPEPPEHLSQLSVPFPQPQALLTRGSVSSHQGERDMSMPITIHEPV